MGAQVERMFDGIAHSYDLLNHTLSFGIDRRWRKVAVKWLKQFSPDSILDVATGTGDFAILGAKEIKPKQMLGIDLSEGMLSVAREKIKKEKLEDIVSVKKEDCMNLSFEDNVFDAVMAAYGIRNFADLDRGLCEMCRVMKPGGHLAVIELTSPSHFPMNMLFKTYSPLGDANNRTLHFKRQKSISLFAPDHGGVPKGKQNEKKYLKSGIQRRKIKRFTFGISMLYMASK